MRCNRALLFLGGASLDTVNGNVCPNGWAQQRRTLFMLAYDIGFTSLTSVYNPTRHYGVRLRGLFVICSLYGIPEFDPINDG